MWILRFIRYFKGYLIVRFSGEVSERMLGICASNRLYLWDVSKKQENILASISIKDFLKLKHLKRKSRVHILKKRGFPFYIKRYNKRIGFAIGLIIFVILMIFLSDRIWTVKVCGNKKINGNSIITALEELNIGVGSCRRKIDTLNSAIELSNSVDGIAWAALNIEGTTLTVDITEVKDEKYFNDDISEKFIAISDGIITKVRLTDGFSLVKPGDSVAKGDVIADGLAELKNGTNLLFGVRGEIYAKTKRLLTHTVPFEQDEIVFTGEVKKNRVLEFFRIRIPLYLKNCKEAAVTSYGGGYFSLYNKQIPIAIYNKTYYFTKTERIRLSQDEALLQARGKLSSTANNIGAINWVVSDEQIIVSDDVLILRWEINCEENIAMGEN